MAKPKRYNIRRTTRFDQQTDDKLVEKAAYIKVPPAVAIRIAVEKWVAPESAK